MIKGMLPLMAADAPALLAEVERGILSLERGEPVAEASHGVLRAVHAVRGGAALAGCGPMERLAGGMESALRLVTAGEVEPGQHLTDALLQAADVLAAMFARPEELEHVETGGALRALEAALGAGLPGQDLARLRPRPLAVPGRPGAFWEVSPWLVEHKLGRESLFCLSLSPGEQSPRELYGRLGELLTLGELLARAAPAGEGLALLYASPLEAEALGNALSLPRESLRPLGPDDLGMEPRPGPPVDEAPETAVAQAAEADPEPPEIAPRTAAPPAAREPEGAPPAPRAAPPPQYLVFDLGPETYGVEIGLVREILTVPPITPLPLSPAHVLGVMNLRGSVVPVFDLRRHLGLAPDQGVEPVLVLLGLEGKLRGLVVDSVRDVLAVPDELVQEPPELAGPVGREHLLGLTEHQARMIILLDLAGLLGGEAVDHAR